MIKKAILLSILFCILCLPLCTAVQDTIIYNFGTDENLIEQMIPSIYENTGYSYHFFILGIGGDGYLDNSTVSCIFFLVNHTGGNIYTEDVTYVDVYWEVNISGDYLDRGYHPYGLICSDAGEQVAALSGVLSATQSGFELTEGHSIILIGMLALLILLFVGNFIAIPLLPNTKMFNEEEELIGINQLGYLKPVLVCFGWFLLLGIFFIGANICYGYLNTELIADLLFALFTIMMKLSILFVILWLCYLLYAAVKHKELKKIIERGWQ